MRRLMIFKKVLHSYSIFRHVSVLATTTIIRERSQAFLSWEHRCCKALFVLLYIRSRIHLTVSIDVERGNRCVCGGVEIAEHCKNTVMVGACACPISVLLCVYSCSNCILWQWQGQQLYCGRTMGAFSYRRTVCVNKHRQFWYFVVILCLILLQIPACNKERTERLTSPSCSWVRRCCMIFRKFIRNLFAFYFVVQKWIFVRKDVYKAHLCFIILQLWGRSVSAGPEF